MSSLLTLICFFFFISLLWSLENQRKRKSNEQNTWMNHTNDLKYQIRQHELQGQFENVESKEQVEQAVKQLQVRHSPLFLLIPQY